MSGELQCGAVIHHRNFQFEDGGQHNKYLVVLGAKPGCAYLCVLVTSQQWILKSEPGCHHYPVTYFFIRGDRENFFPKDTWVQLDRAIVISRAEMLKKGFANVVEVKGNLNPGITEAIRDCLRRSDDASPEEIALL